MEVVNFHLEDTFEWVRTLLESRAVGKGLDLRFVQQHAGSVLLRGDPLRLRQVLINLVSNAIKFTREGEIVVTSEVAEPDAETIELRLSVRDSGIGILQEELADLFSPFTQVDASPTRAHQGSGLGLAISKRIIDQMGARSASRASPAWAPASGSGCPSATPDTPRRAGPAR